MNDDESSRKQSFFVASGLFLIGLPFIYIIAFASFAVQAEGLFGAEGILPFRGYLDSLREIYGSKSYWLAPGVFWLLDSDRSLILLPIVGVLCSLFAIFARGRKRTIGLGLSWLFYLSIVSIGRDFFAFQWDSLLLEAGLIAVLLSSHANGRDSLFWPQLLLRFLLFKLMFSSGVVKMLSGDLTWRSFTALEYHYLSQPLPNVVSYYVSHMPAWFHRLCTASVLAIELLLPFFIFGNHYCKRIAAVIFILLQIAIHVTGNFAFFNMLTILLCLLLLDDEILSRYVAPVRSLIRELPPKEGRLQTVLRNYDSFIFLFFSVIPLFSTLHLGKTVPEAFRDASAWASPLRSFNSYGLFAVMTTKRFELEIEGSMDGRQWLAYQLPYKVAELEDAPPLVAPHQPRLDWQMWFASLGSIQQNHWLVSLTRQLLEGSHSVASLFAHDPFAGKAPKYIRIVRYEYFFTKHFQKKTEGIWWKRRITDLYLEPLTLMNFETPE